MAFPERRNQLTLPDRLEGPIRMLYRAVLLVVLAALAGCGTVRGIGEDMQGVSRAIERVAS